ncbi:MAG: transglycosylase SLT domain-containing protein [Polyangiales bacterium]
MRPLVRTLCLLTLASLGTCTRGTRRTTAAVTRADVLEQRDAADPHDVVVVDDRGQPPPEVPATLARAVEAVRRDDWTQARDVILALPADEQSSREARYILARAYLALDAASQALPVLDGLEALVPALGDDIVRLRAQALAKSGRHADARAVYESLANRTREERDRAHAAIEALAAGDAAAAAPVMRRWADDAPAGIDRARAWKLAAQCLEAIHDAEAAARAWHRILVKEPDSSYAEEAQTALGRLQSPLSRAEMLDRAQELNERARYQTVIDELVALGPGAASDEWRRLHLLGRAYFGARNRYADAHTTLAQVSLNADNPDRDEDAFLSARSLARSDRDEDAIVEYDRVARAVRGRWGSEAAFRSAWLVSRAGRTDEAIARYREFLSSRNDAQSGQRAEAAWELGWALFNARRYGEAATALSQAADLATKSLEKGRGKYWSALALARAGDAQGATRAWQTLIAERPLTYYALLAEARLRERNVTVPAPSLPAPRREAPTVRMPSVVLWLRALGFDREASSRIAASEDSIRASVARDRADEALALAYLSLGYAQRAYAISQRHGDELDTVPTEATRWVWDCSYPRPHAAAVEAAEDASGLPRHYLFAIMRQESGFNQRDVSSARAIGLLQMIPPTTRRVARELGINFQEEMLYDPAYNIRVGGHYIGKLFQQYQGVLPRSIGAYNAGPGAMGRWVRERGTMDLDAFAESIPFDETRIYVRRVLQNLARYRYLYGPREDNNAIRLTVSVPTQGVSQVVDY